MFGAREGGGGVFQWGPSEVMSSNISEQQLVAGKEREGGRGERVGEGVGFETVFSLTLPQ